MRTNNKELDQRIARFMSKKASQFPEVFKDYKPEQKTVSTRPKRIRLAYS